MKAEMNHRDSEGKGAICAICRKGYSFTERWQTNGPDNAQTCSDVCRDKFTLLSPDERRIALGEVLALLEEYLEIPLVGPRRRRHV